MLIESAVPKELWTYPVQTAAIVRNRCFNNRTGQTPYFLLTGRKPNISRMRKFGCECYAYKQDKGKLDSRCTKGIFVGYDKNSPAYKVYFPDRAKVQKFRLVKFVTKHNEEKQTQTDTTSEDKDVQVRERPNMNRESPSTSSQEPGTDNQPEVNSQMPLSDETENSRRYSSRTRKKTDYLNEYESGEDMDDQVLTNIDYCYRLISNSPVTFSEGVKSPNFKEWKAAMDGNAIFKREQHLYPNNLI